MYFRHKPPLSVIDRYREGQCHLTFSYEYDLIGATRDEPYPAAYDGAHYRTFLGVGQDTFDAAKSALKAWRQFPDDVAEVWPRSTPIKEGTTAAVLLKALGLWKLAACRIVYTVDEPVGEPNRDDRPATTRFGVAYGSLPGHVERGEERFLVEWNREDDTVWYDLKAFSRPATLLTWLGMPVARYYQRRFARRSARSMQLAVDELKNAARELHHSASRPVTRDHEAGESNR
ncbi:MAG: DUF1990 domain-containing protein [Pirellulales bacterium]